jgi:hypothetical protein
MNALKGFSYNKLSSSTRYTIKVPVVKAQRGCKVCVLFILMNLGGHLIASSHNILSTFIASYHLNRPLIISSVQSTPAPNRYPLALLPPASIPPFPQPTNPMPASSTLAPAQLASP